MSQGKTMKEAIVNKGPKVDIVDSPIPTPGDDQVLIKVVVSGSNPKDWKIPEFMNLIQNSGDDIAGIVSAVGPNVYEFKPGDRVAAFHEMRTPHGSFAEYAIAWAHTTFHIPSSTSFEEGAAIPLAAMTAACGLYYKLKLPTPFAPLGEGEKTPLVIYGAASAVGSYALQLAKRSNIHPLICVAGRGKEHVEGMLEKSKGDVYVDYRQGDEAVVQGIRDALKGEKLEYVMDAVSEHGSTENVAKVIDPKTGHYTCVLYNVDMSKLPDIASKTVTLVGDVHGPESGKDFGHMFFRYFAKGLHDGWFKAHPQEVVPGGLGGVETGLKNLKEGKASAVKYVFRIADTEGVSKS